MVLQQEDRLLGENVTIMLVKHLLALSIAPLSLRDDRSVHQKPVVSAAISITVEFCDVPLEAYVRRQYPCPLTRLRTY